MKKVIYAVLVVAFAIFLYLSRGDIAQISKAISEGKTIWISIAFMVELVYFFVYTLIFKNSLELVGIKRKLREVTPLVFAAFFVNILAPATGHAGTILFADDSKKRNESASKTVVGVLLTFFAIYLALIAFLVTGVINLKIIGELGYGEIVASIVYLVITIAPIFALYVGHFRPSALRKLLTFIYKIQNSLVKLFKKDKTGLPNWVEESTKETIEAAASAARNKKKSLYIICLALFSHFLNVVVLLLIFYSIGIKLKYGIAITGYAFGEIARVISPQPEGVGTVELTMVLIFSLFGIPPLLATTAVVIYRAMNVWAPMFIGFVSLRTLKTFKAEHPAK